MPTIKLKRNAVSGTSPTTGQLVAGELALNVEDAYLYAENNAGTIVNRIGTTSDRVKYLGSGTGAVPTTVQSKLWESVSVMDFGATLNSIESAAANTIALNLAFAASKNVFVPVGTLYFNGTINVPVDAQLMGAGKIITVLKYTGAGIALNLAGGYTNFRDFFLLGNSTAPLVFDVGTTAIYSPVLGGNITMEDCRIQGFAKHIDGNAQGGFYWKFYNTAFYAADIILSAVASNNISFFGCAFVNFNQGIQSYGGSGGPISIFGCSIEAWSGVFIGPVGGGKLQLIMCGTYIENYPTEVTAGTGLNPMTAAFLTAGEFLSISFIGNNIQCKGIRRVLYNTNAVESDIVSEGNVFYVDKSVGTSYTEYLYSVAGGTSFKAQDTVINIVAAGGSYTTSVVVSTDTKNISGVNPLTDKALSSAWWNISPLNSWANTGNANYPLFSCKAENGILYIRGQLYAALATSAVMGVINPQVLAKLTTGATPYATGVMLTTDGLTPRGFIVDFTTGNITAIGTYAIGSFNINAAIPVNA